MDAFDIFKKLTKGAKFSPTYNPKQLKIPVKPDKPQAEITIKLEKDEYISEDEIVDLECDTKQKNNVEDNSITLLSGLSSSPAGKRGKKRKIDDEKVTERKRKLLETETINQYRNLNNISVVGKHVPEPTKAFSDLVIDPRIIENLQKSGYTEPTAIQKQALPILLEGRQLLACAPTGSGKTAAFLVPVIKSLGEPKRLGFRALILCPTRELARQTQRECVRLSEGIGLRIEIISKIKKAMGQYGANSSQKFDILITTPNRLCFMLKQNPPAVSLANIEWLIIDEADKLFESGNRGFREQFDQIIAACTATNRKIAMFSATYTPGVAKWSVHNMRGLIRVTVGHRNAATDLVEQELLFVGNEQGKLLAFRDLVRKGLSPPVLIFVQSKERAQQLFNELIYDGINVDAIHADRTQLQRDNTVRSFREGRIWVLICTELMARGVDFKGVSLVINYDFPPSAISYVHRVGRAGRAGRTGKAITFFTIDDTVNLRSIAHVLKDSGCDVPEYMLTMKKKPRNERKKLEKSAPKRDDITTKPVYETLKKKFGKKQRFIELQKLKGIDGKGDKIVKKLKNNEKSKQPAKEVKRKNKGDKQKATNKVIKKIVP